LFSKAVTPTLGGFYEFANFVCTGEGDDDRHHPAFEKQ